MSGGPDLPKCDMANDDKKGLESRVRVPKEKRRRLSKLDEGSNCQ